jgi:hypothetical protein
MDITHISVAVSDTWTHVAERERHLTSRRNDPSPSEYDRAARLPVPTGHGTVADTVGPTQPALPIVHNTLLLAFCTTTGQYEPAAHGTGAYADSPTPAQFAPSGHAVGVDMPATGHTLPLRQGTQSVGADLPTLGLKVLATHNTGDAEASGQYAPTGHNVALGDNQAQ